MLIAGFQPLTLLDYPNKLAAIIFTQGCNFACDYCHNPEMIACKKMKGSKYTDPEEILTFMKSRQRMLDGLVITGGEPTLQPDLEDFVKKIKDMNFLVKLDTNGSNPEILKNLIGQNLIDYIAMDLKHTKSKYSTLVKNNDTASIIESINLIKTSSVPYEFRSTILPFFHTESDIEEMGHIINGANNWNLQTFRPQKTLSRKLANERAFTEKEMEDLKSIAQKYATLVTVR